MRSGFYLLISPLFALLLCNGCQPNACRKTFTVTMSLGEQEWHVLRTEVFPKFEQDHNVDIRSLQIEASQLATKLEAMAVGLEEVSSGTIRLGYTDITRFAPHKRNIAMVFQSYALYPHLTVFDNIAFGLQVRGEDKETVRQKVESVSRTLGLEDKLQYFPRQLSGGERQRVATGRAIVREPELFLFDEPLSNLDARLRIELRAEFVKLHQKLKKTVLYVTHDQVEAMSLGQMVVVLKDGLIQQVSSPQELYKDPANLFVAQFIGTPPINILFGTIVEEPAALYFVKGGFRVRLNRELETKLSAFAGQKVYLGFRPSAAALSQRTDISAEVIFTETIGENSFCRLSLQPDIELTVRLTAPSLPQPKQKVCLNLDQSRLYFFNAHEKRI